MKLTFKQLRTTLRAKTLCPNISLDSRYDLQFKQTHSHSIKNTKYDDRTSGPPFDTPVEHDLFAEPLSTCLNTGILSYNISRYEEQGHLPVCMTTASCVHVHVGGVT